jgi:septal ring factor EnvC (AmiA/AmiB activator)
MTFLYSKDANLILEQVRQESQKKNEQLEKITKEQTRKIVDIQAAVSRLEDTLAILDVSLHKRIYTGWVIT